MWGNPVSPLGWRSSVFWLFVASVKSQRKRVSAGHFYIFIRSDCVVSETHTLMCPFNLNPEDITGDFKLVCSSEEDMLLHQSTVMIWPTVTLCFLSFHLTPLWKQLFLVAFLILTMLHCIRSECELKQALMCCGTLFLSYVVECYTLWASSLFKERWGAEPQVRGNEVDAREFKVDESKPSLLIILRHHQHGRMSKYYAWARAVNGCHFRSDSACFLSIHRVRVVRPYKPIGRADNIM